MYLQIHTHVRQILYTHVSNKLERHPLSQKMPFRMVHVNPGAIFFAKLMPSGSKSSGRIASAERLLDSKGT